MSNTMSVKVPFLKSFSSLKELNTFKKNIKEIIKDIKITDIGMSNNNKYVVIFHDQYTLSNKEKMCLLKNSKIFITDTTEEESDYSKYQDVLDTDSIKLYGIDTVR